jgi:hypothetical protein
VGEDAVSPDAERGHDLLDVLFVERAVAEPRACGPESGMPGERQFTPRSEDPHVRRLEKTGVIRGTGR